MYNASDLAELRKIVAKCQNGGKPPIFETNCLVAATEECICLTEQVQELLDYLRLPKFNDPENWVNVRDIFSRLQ